LRLVEAGLRRTQPDSVCSCKLRTLKAQLLVARSPRESLDLLAPPLPPQLQATEFPVRRELVLGEANTSLGDLVEAERRLAEAEHLAVLTAPQLLASIALARGDLAGKKANFKEAERLYAQALDLARKYVQQGAELDALVGLGWALNRQERFDEAMDRSSAALSRARTLHNAVAEEVSLGNLANSYLELGNLDEALHRLEEAESAAGKLGLNDHQQLWAELQGNAYLLRDDYVQAGKHYSRALQLAQDVRDPDQISTAYHNLAQLELARGNPDKAEYYNQQAYAAEGLKPDDRSDPSLVLTTAETFKMRGQLPQAEDALESVLHNKSADTSLLWQAQSDLAGVYVAQRRYDDAEREYEKALQIVEKATGQVKQEERRMSILDAGPFYDDYIQLMVDRDNTDKALRIAEFSRARSLADAFGINAQQRASGLQARRVEAFLAERDRVILAYWLSDKQSYLWVITTTKVRMFHLPGKSEIEKAIQTNSQQIRDRLDVGESTAGQKLYEMLVKPAEELIPPNARITIVPNRSLYKLNFETLVVPGAKPHYWIKDVVVDNASSIALLVGSKRPAFKPSKAVFMVGAPVEVNKDFPALPGAPEEMRRIESHSPAGGYRAVSGGDATPLAYLSGNPGQYRDIVFVSHGTASETRPLDSAIILSPNPDGSYKLYARDIKNIPLHADLVIISACYGLGSKAYSGEGLVGLAWAFLRAGAHQVIAALWEVDDTSNPQLMDDFFRERSLGKSAAESLHDAKIKVVDSSDFHRHPYYWASLQLYTGP
jgi:CHAT domain-containing protein